MFTAQFVIAIRSNADGEVNYKPRYAIEGQRDSMKSYLIYGAQTLKASSPRLLLALPSVFRFYVRSSDIRLAYQQSREPFMRRVFIKNWQRNLSYNLTNASNFCINYTASLMLVAFGTEHCYNV